MLLKIIKFLAAIITTFILIWALNTSHQNSGKPLPAFGKLLNPFSGFWQNAEKIMPNSLPDVVNNQLTQNVKVIYDKRMIPHIFAQNMTDAYFVQGYITAQNRLWQMDFATRAISGRLSEVLGKEQLEFDMTMRRKGVLMGAEKAVESWKKDKENFPLLESYAAGVNAYIRSLQEKDYPIEFKLMGYKPEDWTPLKTALFSKSMALSLNSQENDLRATRAKELFKDDFDKIFPETFKEQSPVIPNGTPWGFKASTVSTKATEATPILGKIDLSPLDKDQQHYGSNNWAIAPWKSKSGNPILCGDPHLGLRLPSIWYELQMHTPDMNVYGVSLPGIPGIIIGFNDNIAWSQTNVGHDVMDWYDIQWKDANRTSYLYNGATKAAELKIEKYQVKGMDVPVFDTVRYTVWGPVVYEDSTALAGKAMHWLANESPGTSEMSTFLKLNKAKNYQDYEDALRSFVSPAQNFAFACKNGDIAIWANGRLPLKNKEQGRFLLDGSKPSSAWNGYIPFEQLPHIKNPKRGFISSANQQTTSTDYPYYYNSENFEAYRGRMINRLLAAKDSITIDDMKAFQTNTYSIKAEEALPLLIKNLDTTSINAVEKTLLQKLVSWNYEYKKDETTPIIFEKWFDDFYDATWDEISTQKDNNNILHPSDWITTYMLRDMPKSIYWDDKSTSNKTETVRDIVTAAFHKAAADFSKASATNPLLNWAKYKETGLRHLAKIDAFSKLNIKNSGCADALCALQKAWGPSWRMVVELGDTPKAWVVYPGGQSGNPGSKQYDAFADKWAAGEYYEAIFMQSVDEKNSELLFSQTFSKSQ